MIMWVCSGHALLAQARDAFPARSIRLVVDNKAGGSGTMAALEVALALPDVRQRPGELPLMPCSGCPGP